MLLNDLSVSQLKKHPQSLSRCPLHARCGARCEPPRMASHGSLRRLVLSWFKFKMAITRYFKGTGSDVWNHGAWGLIPIFGQAHTHMSSHGVFDPINQNDHTLTQQLGWKTILSQLPYTLSSPALNCQRIHGWDGFLNHSWWDWLNIDQMFPTSDNMDGWSSRGANSQRKNASEERRSRCAEKSRNTVFSNILWLRRLEK